MSDSLKVFNIKSDTVTLPTQEMRESMYNSVVGDDVFKEDPTVKELETKAAQLFGKESALFVPSGTMGNLISVMNHCSERGSEFIVGDEAHIYLFEQGGSSILGHVHPRVVPNQPDGTILLDDIRRSIRTLDDHFPITRLVCLENTHNRKGGRVLRPEYINQVAAICKENNLKLHMDGARLMNAITFLGVDPVEYMKDVDSITLCLSKGLAAPIGSLVIGTTEFIVKARRLRKVLGGGMRQVGVIAAPGLIALEKMSKRLYIDHDNAKAYARGISTFPYIEVDPETIETNIVYYNFKKDGTTAKEFCDKCKEVGIQMGSYSTVLIRAVFHYHVEPEDIPIILSRIESVINSIA